MSRRKRILAAVLALATLALASLAIAISHDSPCAPPSPLASDVPRMKAIVARCYGSPDILTFEDIAKPTPADDELLVEVHAAAVNPLDWHSMRGKPYIMRLGDGFGLPSDTRMGVDFAGTVVAVGKQVTRFKPGDEVFGGRSGALAQYLTVRESRSVVLKPANMSFEQAAAVPIAAVTALQGLRDQGHLQPGQKVLINGASGGVGTFAVQIATATGADVTAVCGTANADLVRSLGAHHVIDHTREDFTSGERRYDLVLDNVENHSLAACRRVLTPAGTLILNSGTAGNGIKGMVRLAKPLLLSPMTRQNLRRYVAAPKSRELADLTELIESGKVMPVIDRTYPLAETPAALHHIETGHARGKVVITV